MGMGFWLTEKVRYDPVSGQNLANGTWEYKVPLTKDIPIDFRITFTVKFFQLKNLQIKSLYLRLYRLYFYFIH